MPGADTGAGKKHPLSHLSPKKPRIPKISVCMYEGWQGEQEKWILKATGTGPLLPSCEALVWPDLGGPNRASTLRFLFLKLPFPHWGHPSATPPLAQLQWGYELLFLWLQLLLSTSRTLLGGKYPGPCSWPGLTFEFCQSWILEKMSSCSRSASDGRGAGEGAQ